MNQRINSLAFILTNSYRIHVFMIIFVTTSTNGLMFSEEFLLNEFELKESHSNEEQLSRRSITYRSDQSISMNSSFNPCFGSYIKTNGTTCGLKEVMIGRCYEYQYVKRGLFFSNLT